jgi:hypothetical protein
VDRLDLQREGVPLHPSFHTGVLPGGGSGDASVHVFYATPGSQLAPQKQAAESVNAPLTLAQITCS